MMSIRCLQKVSSLVSTPRNTTEAIFVSVGGVADRTPDHGTPGIPRNTKDYYTGTYHKVRLLSTHMDTSQISIDCAKITHHPSPSPIRLSRTRKNKTVQAKPQQLIFGRKFGLGHLHIDRKLLLQPFHG